MSSDVICPVYRTSDVSLNCTRVELLSRNLSVCFSSVETLQVETAPSETCIYKYRESYAEKELIKKKDEQHARMQTDPPGPFSQIQELPP